MSKIVLNSISDLTQTTTAQTTINSNSTTVQTAFDNTLSRDGTSPNQMGSNLDMNSNQILNLPAPSTVNSPARFGDVTGVSIPSSNLLGGNNVWTGTNNFTGASSFAGNSSIGVQNNITSNYTIQVSDVGKTIVASGVASSGIPFTITLPSTAGFANGSTIYIKNIDTGRGKILSGFPSDFVQGSNILWPNQYGSVIVVGGVWVTGLNPGFWEPSSVLFQTNHASGSDTLTDGLGTGAGAFATIQHAVNVSLANVLIPKSNIVIQNAAETFTESVVVSATTASTSAIAIQGTPGAPGSTVWQTNGIALLAFDNAFVIVNGFKFVGLGSFQVALDSGKFGFIEVDNVEFGTFTNGNQVSVNYQGYYNYGSGTYTVSGNCTNHINMVGGTADLFGAVINVPNALTFTSWLNAAGNASFFSTSTYTGTGSGAGSTGTKYVLTLNATAALNGTTLPGATAGSTSTGGQVV